MDRNKAALVVDQLTAWNVPATVVPTGLRSAAVRIRLGAGREALWDAGDATGLGAQVLRDGVLVGYVAELADSAALPAGHTAWLIATADYDLSPRRRDAAALRLPRSRSRQTSGASCRKPHTPVPGALGDRDLGGDPGPAPAGRS